MIETRNGSYFIVVVPFLGGSSKIKPSPLFDKLVVMTYVHLKHHISYIIYTLLNYTSDWWFQPVKHKNMLLELYHLPICLCKISNTCYKPPLREGCLPKKPLDLFSMLETHISRFFNGDLPRVQN